MDHVAPSWSYIADTRAVHVVMTDRDAGDLAIDSAGVDERRRAVVDAPWSWLRQVHGAAVRAVDGPGAVAGAEADALWTSVPQSPVAVQVADCAPVVLIAAEGAAVGVVHAGWRGLLAGVIEATAAEMAQAGAPADRAVVGACIGSAHYEFGADDLDSIAAALGDEVRATTSGGTPALAVAAAVDAVVERLGIEHVVHLGGCTAADGDRYWSHRARREPQRQSMVAWIEELR